MVILPDDFIWLNIIDPCSTRFIISFENKIIGIAAREWITDYRLGANLDLIFEKTFVGSFHIIRVRGRNSNGGFDLSFATTLA